MVPLLELFAMCDDVFTEDDALSPEKRKITLGRIYEQYKRTRGVLDPGWVESGRPLRPTPGTRRMRTANAVFAQHAEVQE